MPERVEYPPGVPCWVDTTQPDPRAAAAFYGGLFGWEFTDRMPPGADGHYLVAAIAGRDVAAVGSLPAGMPPMAAWYTYVCVADADRAAKAARDAGGAALMGPFDVFDAGRLGILGDPEGAVIGIWQPGTTIGAQLVNEPGTWNFSGLHTRDPEGAAAFYRAVFGWETVDDQGFVTFRLPGYGDHLERRDPELRARMAGVGAPAGFEDVVATMVPLDAGADPPPHWDITFAVDDADATAARTAELGGQVLAPPFDAPWVRMTVLRDPQGATFTASRFVPPG